MDVSEEKKDTFEARLTKMYENIIGSDLLQNWRMRAWDHFLELGLPSRKEESYRNLPLAKLFSQRCTYAKETKIIQKEIAPHILPECKDSFLVIVNGFFDEELSELSNLPDQLVLMDLVSAMKSYGLFLQNRMAKTLKEELSPFAALNASLQGRGIFLYLPPKLTIEHPLQIIEVTLGEGGSSFSSPRIQLYAGKDASLTCYHTKILLRKEEAPCINSMVDIHLEENSKLHFNYDAHTDEESYQVYTMRVNLAKQAYCNLLGFVSGNHFFYQDIRAYLLGEESDVQCSCLTSASGSEDIHTHMRIEHLAPSTKSSQHYKHLLQDTARSSFEGKIYVKDIAQKTEAYQLSRACLLSDKASVYAKPNLEIYADDVKASHGSTTSMIDEEELFYLEARGISPSVAKKMLATGFLHELTDKIALTSFRERVVEKFVAVLERQV